MPARKMPQNLEAEMSVLGVAFLNKNDNYILKCFIAKQIKSYLKQ